MTDPRHDGDSPDEDVADDAPDDRPDDEFDDAGAPDEDELFDDEDLLDDDDDAPAATTVAAGSPEEDLRVLVTYLAASLIDDAGTVSVEAQRQGGVVHLSLRVPRDELGKVIGRQGRIARAIRTAVMVAGMRHDVRATLDIEG